MSAPEQTTRDMQLSPTEARTLQVSQSGDGPDDDPPQIGRYRVQRRLGKGGMGVVYSAYDPELDRTVAIKLMYGDRDADALRRSQDLLRREAQALAKLAHPNIVAIYDVGLHAGQVYVAMEFVVGRTLRQWWEEQRPTWQDILAAMVQAGRGLVAAHAVGLVHRDIKPDNLLIGDDGRVRVADFGIARHDPALDSLATAPTARTRELGTIASRGSIIGTPAYMPPEQHAGGAVGPHSDQFSFCVTLWEGLHGQRPFIGDARALPDIIRAGVPTLPDGAAELPAWLDRAVRRGLAPDHRDRWPSMQALLDVLALDFDARRARARWRLLYAALALALALALVLGGRALQAAWARDARESAAALRLVGVAATVSRMLARGARAEAEETLRAFVQEPELRDTAAAIDAWLMWADHMDALDDRPAAQAAVVEAYTALPEGDPREPAIALRIARQFRSAWNYDALAALGAQVAARWPDEARGPEWSDLRADAALARGDLAGFLALVDAGLTRGKYDDLVPTLRALATRRCPISSFMAAGPADWPGSPGREIVVFERVYLGTHVPHGSIRRMDPDLTRVGPSLDGLTILLPETRPLQRIPGGPDHLVRWERDPIKEISLHELGEGGLREVLRWQDDSPSAAAAADLDGDGVRELYVGTASYTRKLYRLEPDAAGVWQRRPAHPPTDAIHSDIRSLVPGDFDGDGREELAAAVGAWRAFDVRIFAAGQDGALEIVTRRRFGHVTHLAALRAADGSTLLVLAKDDTARSRDAWAPGEPQGEPAGVHIVRRRGDTLEPVAYFPWVQQDSWLNPQHASVLAVGDFDTDGLQDVIVGLYSESQHATAMLIHQRPDGSFASVVFGGHQPLLAGDFDDDPGDELAVSVIDGEFGKMCLLGVPGDPVAVDPAPHRIADTPPLHDPLLARTWARTENLAGFGLFGDAARTLERHLSLTESDADRRALQRRSAELYEAAGDSVRAGERFEALAQGGDLPAALRAVANFEQGLRMADALRVADAALRADGLTSAQASELRLAHERLAAIERRDARVDLRFDRPLDPAWTIHEPLALRLDPVRDQLVVDVSADIDLIASLPIELTGEPLTLEVDVDMDRSEWGTQLIASVRSPAGDVVSELMVNCGGGGGYLRRQNTFGPHWQYAAWDTPSPAERSAHRMRSLILPAHRRAHIEELGDHPTELRIPLERVYQPGPHTLTLRATGIAEFASQQVRGRYRRIALLGARPVPAPEPTAPRDRLALALARADWHAALAVPDDGSPLLRLWRGTALAELGRAPEAVAAFSALDPSDPDLRRQLRLLLRTRLATFAPVLRPALGPHYPGVLLEALQKKGEYPDDELAALRLAATTDLEGLPDADDPPAWTTRAGLLAIRGGVWLTADKPERAAADFAAALALLERAAPDPDAPDATRATLELRLAELAARRGDLDAAAAAARRALLRSGDPEWMAERLRISAALAPLRDDPRWPSILATRR